MKKIVIVLLCAVAAACSKDGDASFNTAITQNMFRFDAVEGGAVMTYTLEDPAVTLVKVEYTNSYGERVVKKGPAALDRLVLTGFLKDETNVPATISLLNRHNEESARINMTFDTKASVLVTLLEDDETKVIPYWDGFQLNVDIPDGTNVDGFVNVYVVGTNLTTHEPDTLLMTNGRIQLRTGKNSYPFIMPDNAKSDYNTVVLKTEDLNARIVNSKTYEAVEALSRVMLDNKDFELIDPWKLSYEIDNANQKFGKKYLFDGDKTALQFAQNHIPGKVSPMYTWLAGPNASQDMLVPGQEMPFFVLDVKQPTVVGQVRFYGMMKYDVTGNAENPMLPFYVTRLPCNIRVWGSSDYDPSGDQKGGTWVMLGEYKQDRKAAAADRWYFRNIGNLGAPSVSSLEEMLKADPYYCSVDCTITGELYRYLKIEFVHTYEWASGTASGSIINSKADVTLHEIDVFAKKD